MTDSEWDAWSAKHQLTFGLNSEKDFAMIDAWREAFERRGYTAAELTDATVWMAGNEPPVWRSEHLARIHKRIEWARLAAYRKEQEATTAEAEFDRCRLCGSTGFVVVPHLKFVRDGIWAPPFYTYAVACHCRKGLRVYERLTQASVDNERCRPIVSIGDYEMANPYWQRQMGDQHETQAAENRAAAASVKADGDLGRIISAIMRKTTGGNP